MIYFPLITRSFGAVDIDEMQGAGGVSSPPSQVLRDHLLAAQGVDLSALAEQVFASDVPILKHLRAHAGLPGRHFFNKIHNISYDKERKRKEWLWGNGHKR
jgi:hypothetical protein